MPTVIGRLTDDVHGTVAAELGIDMVASVAMTVDRVHRALLHAPLDPEYVFGNGETLLVRAQVPGYLDGRRVAEFNVPGEIAVAEITRGGHSLIPGAAALLRDGDRVGFVVAAAALERLRGFLGGRWEALCTSSSRVAGWLASGWPRP